MRHDRLPAAQRPRLQALVIAFAVAFTASLFNYVVSSMLFELGNSSRRQPNRTASDTALLVFGVILVASDPRRSGITLGTKKNSGKALVACGVIIGGTLLYRFALNGNAFDSWNAPWSTWAISPIAQELVFSGFILGLLNEYFPRRWIEPLPLSGAVVASAALFGMWHFIPDVIFSDRDASWLLFRQAYTAIPWMLYAMTRLWTGTILYAVVMHLAVNFISLGL